MVATLLTGAAVLGVVGAAQAAAKVRGTVHLGVLAQVGDQQLVRLISRGGAACYWDGDQVRVDLALKNRSAAHVTVQVEPHYRIRNGGLHGSGLTNWQSIGIDAGAVRKWSEKVGKPAGVQVGAPIASCAPEIEDVSAG